MKFLAILKDSTREAIDTRVFYVTLGLSAFLLLLVASVSFRPLTVQEQAEQTARLFNFATKGFGHRGGGNMPDFQIENFHKTGPDAEPWKGTYRFDFVARLPEGVEPGKGSDRLAKDQLRRFLRERFYRHEIVEVEAVDRTDPTAVRYPVRIEGSKIDNIRDWDYEPSILFSIPMSFFPTSLSGAVYWIEDRLVNRFGAWIGILAGVVITAFFIPNMLRKGTIDLLLAKPVRRWSLLLYKYVGGLSFVFLNTVFVVCGLWLVLGLRSGIWAPGFLISIFAITFFFAILYSVSTFFAVLTRSPIVSILMTVVVWLFLFVVGMVHQFLDSQRQFEQKAEAVLSEPVGDKWWAKAIDAVHFVLPRTNDLDVLTTQFISQSLLTEAERKSRNINDALTLSWGESLTVSLVFVAVLLGLSCWRFTVKDY